MWFFVTLFLFSVLVAVPVIVAGLMAWLRLVLRERRFRRLITEDERFLNARSVPGMEQYGRAIRGIDGNISGSPANYEHSRGSTKVDGPTDEQLRNAADIAQGTIEHDPE